MLRSTKGASKQRRDLINNEIAVLRDLLPLPESARQRLSQLQIMSLACVFIRKCNFLSRLFAEGDHGESNFEFSQAMTGFLLVTSRDGKLLYISENVTEYLGHSMVDMMTQGDSFYDIIDKRDHPLVQSQLMQSAYGQSSGQSPGQAGYSPATAGQDVHGETREERTFFCRMNVARSFRRQAGFGDHKMMYVRGHFIQPVLRDHYGNQPVFMAICSPLITPDVKETTVQNSTQTFYSVHGLDMKFTEMGHIGQHYLGYEETELYGMSWYELLHPEDLQEAKEKHVQLIKSSHEMGCMLTVRLQSKFGQWIWVNIVMHIRQPFVCDNGEPAIVCINHVLDDCDAQHFKLQSQLYSSHIARSPEFLGSPQGTSPQHTITHVPVEGTGYGLSGYAQGQTRSSDEGIQYSLQVTGTSVIPSDTTVVRPEQLSSSKTSTMHKSVQQTVSSSGMHIDSSPDSNSSSASDRVQLPLSRQKQLLREDIMNRLKRKTSGSTGGQHCRPAKLQRVTSGGNNGGSSDSGSINYEASALITNVSLLSNFGSGFSSMSSGDIQVLAPVHDAPVYQQLVQNKQKLMLKQKIADIQIVSPPHHFFATSTMKPPTPLTPDSLSGDSPTDETINLLTIDVNESAFIPDSILTPEASPLSISNNEIYGSPLAHSDPNLEHASNHDMNERCFFEDNENVKMAVAPLSPMHVSPQLSTVMEQSLPVIDTASLEQMLGDLEQKNCQVKTQVTSCQQLVSEENIQDSSSQMEGTEHQIMNNAVTNALMDMVQKATEGVIDFRQFLAVSNNGIQQTGSSGCKDQVAAGNQEETLANISTLTMQMMTTQSSAVEDDFNFLQLEELHQLTTEIDLTAPPPYAGDADLPSSLLVQTL